MTWSAYASEKQDREQARARAQAAAERRSKEVDAQRVAAKLMIEAAFEGKSVSAPYLSNYGESVTFTYAQVIAMLATAPEKVDA
jgi:hypothetical protein